MSGRRVTFVARAPRSLFGRICYWAFIGFNLLMLVLSASNCAVVLPYIASEDPDVAMGAGMFGALLAAGIWTIWPLGFVVLGLLALLTRGRRLTLEHDLPPS
ncbi:hypothetical protein [Roseococcus sp. YIM B11640]|uniref:hypothetical protein n=1 Tax=Roseococcus sp. YIM B11640 TaxID=3133973 RepID=UPI003C7CE462